MQRYLFAAVPFKEVQISAPAVLNVCQLFFHRSQIYLNSYEGIYLYTQNCTPQLVMISVRQAFHFPGEACSGNLPMHGPGQARKMTWQPLSHLADWAQR